MLLGEYGLRSDRRCCGRVMRDTGLTHGEFYKHFESKDELLRESIGEAFREISDKLAAVAEKSNSEAPWKAIVKAYLSLDRDHIERGCPLPAPAPEMACVDRGMKAQIFCRACKIQRSNGLPLCQAAELRKRNGASL